MTIQRRTRRGKCHLVIEISYRDNLGAKQRYRKDAQVQTMGAAKAEEQRLFKNIALYGSTDAPGAAPVTLLSPPTLAFPDLSERYAEGDMRQLKGTTQVTYREVIDNLLLPRLGHLRADEVDRAAMVKLDVELRDAGLSTARRNKAVCVLRSIFGMAVADGLLEQAPTYPTLPKPKKNAIVVPSREELRNIREVASEAVRLPIAVGAFAGLRTGEIRGLRWPDVDLTRRTITVRRSVSRGFEESPKSGHERVVPINDVLFELLLKVQKARTSPWQEVCLTVKKQPWGEFGLNQAFKRACRKLGLSGYTFHCTRHYFVTELFRAGVGAITIKTLAGHADLATTQRYAHFCDADGYDAVARLVATARQQPDLLSTSVNK